MVRNLIDRKQKGKQIADLSYHGPLVGFIAATFGSRPKLKYRILKELRENKDIVTLKPDRDADDRGIQTIRKINTKINQLIKIREGFRNMHILLFKINF